MTSTDSLKTLHTEHIDATKGYETAWEEAKAPDMKDFFARMAGLHGELHADIHEILKARGVQPEDDGSFMAAVHTTIISIKSAVTGLDASSLSGLPTAKSAFSRAMTRHWPKMPVTATPSPCSSTIVPGSRLPLQK